MKVSGWLALLALMLAAQSAHATLYRWVDESGRVQYSDKPPITAGPKGVSQLDSQGIVRKTPVVPETPAEAARRAQQTQEQMDQQRHDRALLQSFSSPKEVDLLRDRQIDAVNGSLETNKQRRLTAQARLDAQTRQMNSFVVHKKPVPEDLSAAVSASSREIADIDADNIQKTSAIAAIRQKAEADKKRLIELLAGTAKP